MSVTATIDGAPTRTLHDMGDFVWLVSIAWYVLLNANAGCKRGLQDVHLFE